VDLEIWECRYCDTIFPTDSSALSQAIIGDFGAVRGKDLRYRLSNERMS